MFLTNAQVTLKKNNLQCVVFFLDYVRASVGNSLQYLINEMSIGIFRTEKCEVTFVFLIKYCSKP